MSNLSNFFNTYFNIHHMIKSKRAYQHQMARVKALPKEYQYVFKKIQHHMWMFTTGSGEDMMEIHSDLIDLFESGVANNQFVLEITGDDVATFCDELLRNTHTFTSSKRHQLNREISKKLKPSFPTDQ